MTRRNPQIADQFRKQARYGSPCRYCGRMGQKMNVDHVIPLCRGGADHPDNMVMCCKECNQLKGDMMPDQWQFVMDTLPEWWNIGKHVWPEGTKLLHALACCGVENVPFESPIEAELARVSLEISRRLINGENMAALEGKA